MWLMTQEEYSTTNVLGNFSKCVWKEDPKLKVTQAAFNTFVVL